MTVQFPVLLTAFFVIPTWTFLQDKSKSEHVRVRTAGFCETIKKCCEIRCEEWSYKVKGRLEYSLRNLHAADCVYHHTCSVNF